MVATGGGNSKSCKLMMKVKFNVLVQYSVDFLHLQVIHILALSPQIMIYIAWVLAKNIQVWNQDSLRYRVRVVQTTLQALFRSTITGVVVQSFRSSSVPVLGTVSSSHGLYCMGTC